MDTTSLNKKYRSHILTQLINLGFTFLTPSQALAARQGKIHNVLLEDILRERVRHLNRIHYKGSEFHFTEENIRLAIEKLRNTKYEGLCKTNETIHERLTLGLSLEQPLEGYAKSFTLRYIDWQNWTRNAFHVASNFPITLWQSPQTIYLDIVLFVNGIPFVIIESVPPQVPIEQAIAQSVRHQQGGYSPASFGRNLSTQNLLTSNIFSYVQVVVATNQKTTQFGAIGTPARFWSTWKEPVWDEQAGKGNDAIFPDAALSRKFLHKPDQQGEALNAEQTKTIHGLCLPERLLEFSYKFNVFDNGIRKIARHQQYFAIKRILAHIRVLDAEGRRRGGIIWHTQGSGKSLTMVMLARSLAEETGISNPRIVLVTDRKDLDEQIKNTFAACDMAPQRAKTGRDLLQLVSEKKASVITTLVQKFDKALNIRKYQDDSIDIFMLIDESHRTQFGAFAARMRQMFPNACYLGFTGTPLMEKEKNNFAKFGGLIDCYSISQAIQDQVIVPLLYEGRHIEMHPDKHALDAWFERHTQGLTDAEKARLKKKYSGIEYLNKTEKAIYLQSLDISKHFQAGWQNSGYKGQLVAPSKAAALTYHNYLTEIGLVSSAVIISPPDNDFPSTHIRRERKRRAWDPQTQQGKIGDDIEIDSDDVSRFWQKMIRRYGSEEEYNKQIINRFKYGNDPEILIVVDKLQTGFDAPCNAVLYLTRPLRGHTLLQTIARVNRIHEDEGGRSKPFGLVVDYAGILGELNKALTQYSAFEGFDDEDLASALVSVHEEIEKLPRQHAELQKLLTNDQGKSWDDEEIRNRLLHNEALQNTFRKQLSGFCNTLDIALTNDAFLANIPAEEQREYQRDHERFQALKATIDHHDHKPRIEEMLNTHIQADEAIQLNPPEYIFPVNTRFNASYWAVSREVEMSKSDDDMPSPANRANHLARITRNTLAEYKGWNSAFYDKFSNLIKQAVDDFKEKRLSDIEYLEKIKGIRARVEKHEHGYIPSTLQGKENAIAFYQVVEPYFSGPVSESTGNTSTDRPAPKDMEAASRAAIALDDIFHRHWKVRFWNDYDTVKQVMNDIDDYFYDEVNEGCCPELSVEQMDEIIEKVMETARNRIPAYSETYRKTKSTGRQ
ncbi:MAG: type I restriction enzyme, R subunit [Candidatus Kentron sp. G]|nr:MAG: type I restriction enzyme, R subunit [Candidatus Kentron sp. G]VFM95607.1 MAG: type I restriction enzyme, R subunit [Candidatus Kentron sp. G]VFM97241.1 MAG: type I restriction enzyme, R subunit [Candidatus Kentron sp. G]